MADSHDARLEQALSLFRQQRFTETIDICRTVQAEDPEERRAWGIMVYALRVLGRNDEACTVLEEQLAGHPEDPYALYNLTLLDPVAPEHPRFAQAQRALSSTTVEQNRMFVHFALALMHEAGNDHARAFAAWRDGNACFERYLVRSGRAFDRGRHAAEVDSIIEHSDAGFFDTRADCAAPVEYPPVLVLGVSRSGKSLLANLLAAHPQLVNLDERSDLEQLAGRHARDILVSPGAAARNAAQRLARDYTTALSAAAGGAAVQCVDTHPLNFRNLDLLGVAVAGARVIYVQRDPRDLLVANFCMDHGSQTYSYNLEDCAAYLRDYKRLMAHWRAVLPLPIHDVHYEDLVREPERVIREALDFLGLEWDEVCRSDDAVDPGMHVHSPVISLAVRSRPDPAQIGLWRRYARWLPDIESTDPGSAG